MGQDERKLATDVSQTLRRQRDLLKVAADKEAGHTTKIASLETQLQIHRDVIELVSRGNIDPSDAAEKLAMFLEDPAQFEVVKQAIAMGLDQLPSIGAPAVDPDSSIGEDKDPIAACLEEMEPHLRTSI